MAESDNDSLSVDDLVVAINGWAPQTRSQNSTSDKTKEDASSDSMDEDELDLLSALGLAPRKPKPSPAPAQASEAETSTTNAPDASGASRAEQQVRSQQWQQEMRRRDARFARMPVGGEEVLDAAVAQPEMPFIEEGGLSKSPTSAASGAPVSAEPRFEHPQEYEPVHIPEPTFLSQQPSAQPAEALATPVSQVPASEQPSVQGQPLRPFGSAANQEFKSFTRRVIEPLDAPAPQSADAPVEERSVFSTIEPLQPLAQQVEDTIQGAQAVSSDVPAGGVVKRSFSSSDTPMSSIQRLDEVQQLGGSDDQESFVERKQVSLADSTDAVATGMLGSIQPMAGSGEAREASAPYIDTAPGTAEATFETFEPQDHFDEIEEVEKSAVETIEPVGTSEPVAPPPSFAEPVSTPASVSDQGAAEAPAQTTPAMPIQPGVTVPGQPVQFDQFGNPMPTGQFAAQMDQQPFAAPQQMGGMQPMQSMQPMPGVAPGTPMSDGQLDVQRHSASSKRNSILGIILIIVALLCAVMAVGMLSGIFNMDAASNTRASSSTASSAAPASDATPDEGTTEAVYTYVVRGVDGTTHEATETATFNADGFLEGSTIELQVNDAETANALLEQLKSEFGSSVVSSEADENHVLITLDINRDDLTKEAYTELLLANMTEFKQIS